MVADGIKGLADEVHKHFPETDVQRCVVHLERNLLNKVRSRDKEAFAADLKHVFNNFDKHASRREALEKLDNLSPVKNRWKSQEKADFIRLYP